MALKVVMAVYGALAHGQQNAAEAFDRKDQLQTLIDNGSGVVKCDGDAFGDPAQGFAKHFAAIVNRDDVNFFFACEEGQTIDFNSGGGQQATPSGFMVESAVYGALPNKDRSLAKATDVSSILQDRLNQSSVVDINNGTFGDPALGSTKHFAAVVNRNWVRLGSD